MRGDWAVHFMEHALSAVYPAVSHGAGLGVAFPCFVRANVARGLRLEIYARIARDLFGTDTWEGLLEGFDGLLLKWGHPRSLSELVGREVGAAERQHLGDVYAMRSRCGYYADGLLPRDIVDEVFAAM